MLVVTVKTRAIRLYLGALFLSGIPVAASAAWLEASSTNFVVYADDSEKNLHRMSEQLELYHQAMERLVGIDVAEPSPSNRVVVYVVRSQGQVQQLYGEGGDYIGGFYIPRAGRSLAIVPQVRARNGDTSFSMIVLLHEYAHHLVTSNSTTALPPWLDEGSAEFFASARFPRQGGIQIGMPAQHRAMELQYARDVTIEQLLDPELYQRNRRARPDAFYGKSWALYHYLSLGAPERKGQITRYVSLLAEGKGWREAALTAFGDFDELDEEIYDYLKRKTMYSIVMQSGDLQIGPIDIRALTQGEAAIMPVMVRSRRGVDEEQARELVADARKIAAAHPDDPAVLAALAEAEFDAGEDDRAIAAADAALAQDPACVNAYLQKGFALFRKAATGSDDRPQAFRLATEPFLRLNRLENDHPLPLLYYYLSFLRRGESPSDQAVLGLRRAVELAPFDVSLRLLYTRHQIATGDYDGARSYLRELAAHPHAGAQAEFAQTILQRMNDATETRPDQLLALLDSENAGNEAE